MTGLDALEDMKKDDLWLIIEDLGIDIKKNSLKSEYIEAIKDYYANLNDDVVEPVEEEEEVEEITSIDDIPEEKEEPPICEKHETEMKYFPDTDSYGCLECDKEFIEDTYTEEDEKPKEDDYEEILPNPLNSEGGGYAVKDTPVIEKPKKVAPIRLWNNRMVSEIKVGTLVTFKCNYGKSSAGEVGDNSVGFIVRKFQKGARYTGKLTRLIKNLIRRNIIILIR